MTRFLRKIYEMMMALFIRLTIVQKNQPLFDEECSAKRQLFYNKLDNFRQNKTACNQRKLTEAHRNFKNEIRPKRYLFDNRKTLKSIGAS